MDFLTSAQFNLLLGFLLFAIPLGATLMNYQINIPLGAFCWIGSVLLIAIWVWRVTAMPPLLKVAGVATIILWGSVGTYYAATFAHVRQMAVALTGELVPISEGKRDDVTLQLGMREGGARFRPTVKKGQIAPVDFVPFEILGDKLRIRRDNKVLKVSTVIRNKDGNLIVEIVDNHWKISATESWDKNYTQDTLEVKDNRGRIVLQVRVLPDVVQINGEWNQEGGGVARIYADGKDGGTIQRAVPPAEMQAQFLEPIFEYPSDKHWGELRQP